MYRVNVHASQNGNLSTLIDSMTVKAVNEYTSSLLLDGLSASELLPTKEHLLACGWPIQRSQTTRHLKFQVKPRVYDHLQKLAAELGLSVSRSALVVFEHAAQQLQKARAASSPSPELTGQSPAAAQPQNPPVRAAAPSPVVASQEGIYPPEPGVAPHVRNMGGKSQTWISCRLHRDMDADQTRDVNTAGGMWVDTSLYEEVFAQGLDLNEMMRRVVQARVAAAQAPTAQVIELPSAKPVVATVSLAQPTKADDGLPVFGADWMEQAAAMFARED